MVLTLEEIRERDNREALSTGRERTIGDTAGVQSLLVEDTQANATGRGMGGAYEERWFLKCMTADLPVKPIPDQVLHIDGEIFLVEAVRDIEGVLDIRMVVRRT